MHQRFLAEEVASALRHGSLNGLTGLGALGFQLTRRLEAGGRLRPEDREILASMKAAIADAGRSLDRHFLAPAAMAAPLDLAVETDRVVAALAGAQAPLARAPGLAPGLPPVAIDAGELAVALGCLLENALEAAPVAGALRVACTSAAGGLLAVTVEDDGPGFGPEAAERAFDPFFSTKPGRLGLGLAIARRIALRWGGRVDLRSPGPGRTGTQARLLLPPDHEPQP
jgi:two-component system sensor histidine kinase TtrS